MNLDLKQYVESFDADAETMSDQIWEFAELRFEEKQSSKLQADYLEAQGFRVQRGIAGIPTAFRAEYGSRHPVLGFLGEFDALPELSQEADCSEQKPIREGCPGHGCGHNLLGTGALQAACGLKKYMETEKIAGTVVYFGCPAEEGGAGKGFMVQAGCFKNIDFAFAWHPSSVSRVEERQLASRVMTFTFYGKSAHASSAPWKGRSALDACELMNIGVNYLREHVRPDSRMHYAYNNAGGSAPNVVPHQAELLYYLRSPDGTYAKELAERVSDIARGAALMTGTSVEINTESSYANLIAVPSMSELMEDCMREFLPLSYSEEELEYARTFVACGTEPQSREVLHTEVQEPSLEYGGSTDVGDVSWQLPTTSINVTTVAAGTVLHSWNAVAQGKSSIAHKGMHAAARILAEAGYRLLTEEETREKIQKDFRKVRGTEAYEFPVASPPVC